mmetsp:Transcript_9982/g.17716  ORF Transcript_9982/g.17716 Transcript_9982/m.17716 type:complete len:812 (+) Transcript_9982:133-2568(+)|eukprot:CAMPEP_0171548134 /NCGR_PEP_ID=MMETSP0960-20121227/5648_1 /TAXON_ID=87120 /ORGANISM="Aurantiochytrium limacinum, Strain ATCCMYA-1381" /LENGTH=811 /DNA_ID=CAMNT_0012096541 /DNA_START=45 /DNA_END=2480 /DNA_ORIENTATION=-
MDNDMEYYGSASQAASDSPSDVLRDLLAASSGRNDSGSAGAGETSDVELELEHWERFVEALDTRANATKKAVQNVLVGHHPEFADTFSCSQEVGAQVGKLREDLRQAMDEASSEESFQGAGVLFLEEKNRIRGQLQRLSGLIETLEEMQAVQASLDLVDNAVDAGSLADAGSGLRSAEDSLDSMVRGGGNFVDSKVSRAVRVLVRRKKAKLQAAAEALVRASLRITERTISVSSVRGAFKIQEAFAALDALGTLRALARKEIGGPLLQLVLRPIVADGTLNSTTSQTDRSIEIFFAKSTQTEEARAASPRSHDMELRLERVFEHVLETLRFIDANVFGGNVEWMALLSDSVWGQADPDGPGGLAALLRETLVNALPEDPSLLASYQGLALSAKELEDVLDEMGLAGNGQRPLLAYLNDLHGYLAKKRRSYYLEKARTYMLEEYSTAERSLDEEPESELFELLERLSETGDQGPGVFRVPDMKVTQCAKSVLRLCYQCLEEAVRTGGSSETEEGTSLSSVLVHTCRDMIELFRILVPARHKRALSDSSNGRLALLLHNDCIFISCHLVVIGFVYRHRLPGKMHEAFLTVDLVPSLRELSATQLNTQLRLQSERLVRENFTDSAPSSPSSPLSSSNPAKGKLQTPVDTIAERLEACQRGIQELASEFDEILEVDLAAQSLASVVNSVVEGFLSFVGSNLASSRAAAARASPDSDLTLSSNEISSLRESLQSFKDVVSGEVLQRLRHQKDRNEIDHVCPGILVLTQISACLERFLSIHIFQDKVKAGALAALNSRQVRGLTTFLFPSDSPLDAH